MASRRGGRSSIDELAPFVLANVKGLKEDSQEAGHGAYGVVYNVTVNGLKYVAKRLHKALVDEVEDSENIKQKFRNECITLSRLKHPNIVHFIGVHYGRERSDLTLIMECLPSDLSSFLKKHPQIPLPLKLAILLDVAYGLLYLHTHNPPIVHRDLTDRNILITSDGRAKLADLGMAKLLTPQALMAINKHTKVPGRLWYMPPETLTENPECTPKIDVFSFGHLSLFTINEEDPKVFEITVTQEAQRQGRIQILKRRPSVEKVGQDHCMYPLITRCLHDNPAQRPKTAELTEKMQELSMRHPLTMKIEDIVALSKGEIIKQEEHNVIAIQALQYKEDFEKERKDRENAVGRHVEEIASWQLACQKLRNEVEQLTEKLDILKTEQAKDIAQVLTATKQSLEEKIEDIDRDRHAKEKNLEIALNEKAALDEHLERVRQQLDETVKENSVELMGKNQQAKQFRKQVEEITGHLQETRAELDGVKVQLKQTRARMQEQVQFYQEQLKQTDEQAESKAQFEKEAYENDKLLIESELHQLKRRYEQLRDRYDVLFKHNDHLKAILRKHNVSPPPLPKVSRRLTPHHYQTGQPPQRDVQAVPILTRAPNSPIDPNTLPQPAVQVATQYPYHQQPFQMREQPLHRQGSVEPAYQILPQKPQQQPWQYHGSDGMIVGTNQGYVNLDAQVSPRQQQQQRGQNQAAGINTGQQLQNAHSQMPVAPPRPIPRAHSNPDVYQHYRHQAGSTGKTGLPQSPQPSPPNKDINYSTWLPHSHSNRQPYRTSSDPDVSHRPDSHSHPLPRQHSSGQASPPTAKPRLNIPRARSTQDEYQPYARHQAGSTRSPTPPQSSQPSGDQYVNYVNFNVLSNPQAGMPQHQHQTVPPSSTSTGHGRASGPTAPKPTLPKDQPDQQENILIQDIDQEIQYVAQQVKNEEQEGWLAQEAPFDPNLICQMCKKKFRIGEIQKYRRHVATCTGPGSSAS